MCSLLRLLLGNKIYLWLLLEDSQESGRWMHTHADVPACKGSLCLRVFTFVVALVWFSVAGVSGVMFADSYIHVIFQDRFAQSCQMSK